jgi:hypothetical protein
VGCLVVLIHVLAGTIGGPAVAYMLNRVAGVPQLSLQQRALSLLLKGSEAGSSTVVLQT